MNIFNNSGKRSTSCSRSEATCISGFVCPDCMLPLDSSEMLLAHFEEKHAFATSATKLRSSSPDITNSGSIASQKLTCVKELNKKNVSQPQLTEQRHLLFDELTKHNHTLMQRIANDNKRILELELLLDLLIDGSPLPHGFSYSDQRLEERINRFLDDQTKRITAQPKPEAASVSAGSHLVAADDHNEVLDPHCVIRAIPNELAEDSLESKVEVQPVSSQASVAAIGNRLMDELESKLAVKSNEAERLSAQVAKLQHQLDKLRTENHSLSDQLVTSTQRNRDLEANISRIMSVHQVDLEKRDENLYHLRTSLEQVRSELEAANSRCAQLEEQSKQLNATILNSEIHQSEAQAQFDSKLEDSRKQLMLARKETDSLLDRLMNAEDKCTSLEQKLISQTKVLDDLHKALFELGHENQSLQMLREKITTRHWTKDTDAPACSGCGREFSLSNRRHHCRSCGGVFCDACSANRAPTAASKYPVRVCDTCYRELSSR